MPPRIDWARLQPNMPAPTSLMSVCPPADRWAREHGPVHGSRWRTPDRRSSMSSKHSDNCGRNSSHHDYGWGRTALRSSLGRHICLLRRKPKQWRGRTYVRESYRKDADGYRRSIERRRAKNENSLLMGGVLLRHSQAYVSVTWEIPRICWGAQDAAGRQVKVGFAGTAPSPERKRQM